MNCKIILPPNDIYKLPAVPSSFDELMREIHVRLRNLGKDTESFSLKYMDAENELVTLANEEDFSTAVLTGEAEKLKTLKVHVFITESPKTALRNISLNYNGTVKVRVKSNTEGAKRVSFEDITPEKSEESGVKVTTETTHTPRGTMSAGKSDLSLSNKQIEAINTFVGTKVKQALEANIKQIMPEFIAKIQGQDKSPINSQVVRDLSQSFSQDLNQSLNLSRDSMSFPTCLVFNNDANTSTISIGSSGRSSPICNECRGLDQKVRYVCPECADYKCCEKCEEKIRHEHNLLKLRASETQNLKTSLRGNFNMRFSFPNHGRSQVFSSSNLKVVNMKSSTEKKINYKGVICLERAKDHLIHIGPNANYSVQVTVKNTGKETWPADVKLSCVNGILRGKEVNLNSLEPGEKRVVTLRLKSPRKSGRFLTQWRLYFEDAEMGKMRSFGESLFLEVAVEGDSKEESKEEAKREGGVYVRMSDVSERRKLAEYLDEIFPGDLEEKVNFIEKFGSMGEIDMCVVVEKYLQEHARGVRGKKGNGCRPESVKMNEKIDLSLTMN